MALRHASPCIPGVPRPARKTLRGGKRAEIANLRIEILCSMCDVLKSTAHVRCGRIDSSNEVREKCAGVLPVSIYKQSEDEVSFKKRGLSTKMEKTTFSISPDFPLE